MKDILKKMILRSISNKSPITSVNLALNTIHLMHPAMFAVADFYAAIAELLREKEIIELEYTDSNDLNVMRVKSLYFKKGTIFNNLSELTDNEHVVGKSDFNDQVSRSEDKRN